MRPTSLAEVVRLAAAVVELAHRCRDMVEPLSLVCVVLGHLLPHDHWYRHPQEGTRIWAVGEIDAL